MKIHLSDVTSDEDTIKDIHWKLKVSTILTRCKGKMVKIHAMWHFWGEVMLNSNMINVVTAQSLLKNFRNLILCGICKDFTVINLINLGVKAIGTQFKCSRYNPPSLLLSLKWFRSPTCIFISYTDTAWTEEWAGQVRWGSCNISGSWTFCLFKLKINEWCTTISFVLISAFHTDAGSTAISNVTVTPSTVDDMTYTSCFNITVTATETFMDNFTTYIPQTTISYVQSLFTTTMTTMVPTTVVYTTILAPSTVTVEVTPSPTTCQDRTTFINITNTKFIEEAVENITKALYVDKKQISSYVRSKTCAEDNRSSSATVGYFGIVFIAVPFGLIFLLDLRSICAQMRDTAKHCQPCSDE